MSELGRFIDVTPVEYHNDPCEVPSLSASIAKIVVEKSPKHAWQIHPRLGGAAHEPTIAMDRGTVFHRLILGKGGDYGVVHADDWRTNGAKSQREAIRASGKTPLLAHQMDGLQEAAASAAGQIRCLGYSLAGRSEAAVTWKEPVMLSDHHVRCRAMFDHVHADDGLILDVKTIDTASVEDCIRSILRYGYHIQHAAYTSAMRHVAPSLAGLERMVFLFCETEPPYAVTPIELDGAFRELGRRYWERAVRIWNECLRSGKWPAYTEKTVRVGPPVWAISKALEAGLDVQP